MHFDIRTLLVAVALANAFCTGARVLLWRMHPTIPGLGRWALAGAFGALAFALLIFDGSVAWLPTFALAQALAVGGLVLAWDGFRRFGGQTPLSYPALSVLAAGIVGWVVAAQVDHVSQTWALGNAALVALLSALIAWELLGRSQVPTAMGATGWVYAANGAFFVIRIFAAHRSIHAASPLNPDGVAAVTLLWWLCVIIAVTLGMVLMTAERLQADLDRQANRDPLTGALNRRAFSLIGEKVMARARRYGKPLAVLLMDLDNFKQINDRLGHDAGDALLCRFVAVAGHILRGEDIFCRYGGEEFVALLPDTSAEQALVAAERLRAAFLDESAAPIIALDDSQPGPVTVSIGIGELEQDEDIDDLLRRADTALYQAKGRGRNRCELAAGFEEESKAPDKVRAN